jgi:hypothetical protein
MKVELNADELNLISHLIRWEMEYIAGNREIINGLAAFLVKINAYLESAKKEED